MLNLDDVVDAQTLLRRTNLRRALQLVFQNSGAETRAEIARGTGLTAATASSLVAELIESRLVVPGAQVTSKVGKPPTTLSINTEHHVILAILIHQFHAQLTLVRLDGTEHETRHISFAPEARESALYEAVSDIAQAYGERILVAGAQIAGTTDGRSVLESVQLQWKDLPLADRLEERLGAPVVLVNDVGAASIAEAAVEKETSGYRLFIHLGVGIGAAVTLDGERPPGPQDRAGEIGHVQVQFDNDARHCLCGRVGCLEAASSLAALLGATFTDAMPPDEIAEAADFVSNERLREAARALGRAIKLIAAFMDAAEVVIGGPGRALGDRFLDLVRAEVSYIPSGTAEVPVRFADLHTSNVIGVAQVALTAALGVRWSADQVRHPLRA